MKEYKLGQSFKLTQGQTVQIIGEEMSIRFEEKQSDTLTFSIHSKKVGPTGANFTAKLSQKNNSVVVFHKYTLFLEEQTSDHVSLMIGLIP